MIKGNFKLRRLRPIFGSAAPAERSAVASMAIEASDEGIAASHHAEMKSGLQLQ